MASRMLSVLRTHDDRTIPKAGLYEIDAAHTAIEFLGRHLMISKVRGRFDRFEGQIAIAEEPENSHVEVKIDASSLSTGNDERDAHLRSADFFDVEQYPDIWFRSTSVMARSGSTWQVVGDLTIRDTTRSVVLQVDFEGGDVSMGAERIAFTAASTVDREDFGLTWNVALETGGWLVGNTIRIDLTVEAVATPQDVS